jgi:hypothetical protein
MGKKSPTKGITNLIVNGDFSDSDTSWQRNFSPSMICEVVTDNSTGNSYLRTAGQGNATQALVVKSSTEYVASCKGKSLYKGQGSLQITNDGPTKRVGFSDVMEWEEFTLPFTTTANASAIIVKLTGSTGEIFFDDIVLAELESDDELIKNGRFDDAGEHWTPHQNNVGARVNFNDGRCEASGTGYSTQAVATQDGTQYVIVLKARSTNGGQGSLQVRAEGQPTRSVTFSSSAETDYSLAYTATSSEVEVRLASGAGGVVYFVVIAMRRVR